MADDLAARIAQLPADKQAQLAQALLRARRPAGAAGPPPPAPARFDPRTSADGFCCTLGQPGHFDGIRFAPLAPTAPGPGQVQIRARAVSLNFRDLMIAMNLYPPSPGVPSIMGSDYAGEVLACGEGVSEFRPGDAVLALSAGHVTPAGQIIEGSHLRSTLNLLTQQVVALPPGLSFEAGSALPTVFLTCYYALHRVARLARGERVLIHSATGGVGLAAIEIARWLGAEVYATAGSEPKREFLASLGIRSPMDSRSTAFGDRVMELTGGEGVDVVLNTLAGEQAVTGLRVLRTFGRFLQIDKQDISQNASLELAPFAAGLTYTGIDLSLFLLRPERLKELFQEVVDAFARGDLLPIRTTVYPVQRLSEALGVLSRYGHIGKLVLSYD